MKHCNRCDTTKPKSEFNKNSRKKDGHQSSCRDCMKSYLRSHYNCNKQSHIETINKRRLVIREQFAQLKTGLKCNRCPEDHPSTLDFHHSDPASKELSVSTMVHDGWNMERIKAEIAKCEVLCSNCHRKLHWQERNGAA